MLRPSSVRDASTCLRCDLRLVLRQIQPRRYQSSDESPQASQEFPASTVTPPSDQQQKHQAPRLRIIRHHFNHGKIRGKKGSQRRVESAEALSISSLGQDSEVIVLRDLHEPRVETKKPDDPPLDVDFDDLDDAEQSLAPPTASDIENMSAGRRAIRPKDQEVFESIDGLRPPPNLDVVKEVEFRAMFTALAKGYTIGQLKGYLLQELAPTRLASSNARSPRRAFASEITSSSGDLQVLKRTAWHLGTTPIARRLTVTFSAHASPKMNNKEDVIESILRHAWTLSIEEEKKALGEIEFLLSPMQFGLLLTKNSKTLQPLLESTKFYTNSRFQLHQADHVIRIVGPRSEAEEIALVLTQAYAPAKSADIHLDIFDLALSADRAGYTLQDMLSPAQLTRIMQLTRTYVHYDSTAKRVRIASFADVAINDAHRLLVALLDTRTRTKVARIYDSHNAEKCRLENISTNKDMPSFARDLPLGRWVTSSLKAKQSATDQTLLDIQDGHSVGRHDDRTRVEDAGVTISPLSTRSPIMKRAFAIMKTCVDSSEKALDTNVSIWSERPPMYDFWRAHVGLSLHNDEGEATYPGAQGLYTNEEKYARSHRNIFTSKVPGLVGLLASIPPNDPKKEARVRRTRLIAHLIPSPFEHAKTWASTAFPKIQLRFYIEGSTELRMSEKHVFADLPSGKRIVFQDIRAVIRTEIVQLNLPSHPADIQFKREQRLVSRRVSDDVGIKSFIDAIFESMKSDSVLRAPPALQVPIPQNIVAPMPERYLPQMRGAVRGLKAQIWSKQASKSGVVPVKYLFAGFEYQEARDFDLGTLAPYHKADLRSFEGGVTGGRRLDLSLLAKDAKSTEVVEDSKSVQRLVDASTRLINALAESQVGQPRSRPHLALDTRPRKSRKTASESEEHPKEMQQRRLDKKKTLQAYEISNMESSEVNKAAEQDRASELGTDQDHTEGVSSDVANAQDTITVEKPETQTRVFDSPAEQEQTEQTSSPDASTSTSSAIDNDTTEQISTQASPDPETQEAKAEEAKAVEEEPLSVRLQRMMGGGR